MVCRQTPPPRLRHDRRDHVDELGKAGALDAVGVVQQRNAGAAEGQGILHGVDFLENGRRHRPALLDAILARAPRAVPHIPFIEAQSQAFGRPVPRRHRIGDGNDLLDEHIHQVGRRQEAGAVAPIVVEVGVERDEIDELEGVLEHLIVPAPEGWHVARGRAAGGQHQARVDPAHHLGGLGGDAAVFGRRLVLHLPGAIHFVAEAPELHAMRGWVAVRVAQVGIGAAAGMVAVFDEIARRIAAARAEVDGEHGLDLCRATPVDELVGAEPVGLGGEPGKI